VEPIEDLVLLEPIDQDVDQRDVFLRCNLPHGRSYLAFHASSNPIDGWCVAARSLGR